MGVNSADMLAAQNGGFEPQRQSNWELIIAPPGGAADAEAIKLAIISSSLPSESSDEIELNYGNEKRYVAGKTTFEAIPLVINDFVDKTIRDIFVRWRRNVYKAKSGAIGYARDYKVDATIVLYGPDGVSDVRECKLFGCWPQAVTGGTLDHASSEPVQMEVQLRYDKADWEL